MAKAKIDAKDALDDIKAGMDAVALMQKYGLSPEDSKAFSQNSRPRAS